MSNTINASKLFQISMSYDRHRLKINSIKSRSASTLRKQTQQNSILSSRNMHKQYNSKFRHRQSQNEINKKNSMILNKLKDMSKVKKPTSAASDNLRNSMIINRSKSKQQQYRNVDIQNSRFVKKLFAVKSTISFSKNNNSFHNHLNRSQMLSKFKKNQRGFTLPKTQFIVEKRIKLQPIHQKLQIIQSHVKELRVVKGSQGPLKFNTMKLRVNPERF